MVDRSQAEAAKVELRNVLVANRVSTVALAVVFRSGANAEYEVTALLHSDAHAKSLPETINGVKINSVAIGQIISLDIKNHPDGWSNVSAKRAARVSVDPATITVEVGLGK